MSAVAYARRSARRLPAGTYAGVGVLVVLLLVSGRYELHGDELYFRMLPLDWWYEDQPPLTVWLSRLAARVSPADWVQRVPSAVGAAVGALVAAALPRSLGAGRAVQEAAAWSHATTVYPLIVGHVFLTSSLDLLVWQLIVLAVVKACRGRSRALAWGGLLLGVGCWNKLLVIPLAGALLVSALLVRRDLLRSRWCAVGAAAAVFVGLPQVLAQALHGWPMARVSGDLIALHGGTNRWLVVPLLVAFVGPPLVPVLVRGLRWGAVAGPVGVLAPAALLLVVWNVLAPAQPYYAVGLLLPALSLGWAATRELGGMLWRRRWPVIAANALVAALLALPLVPVGSPAHAVAAGINPVARDQVGWRSYVAQVEQAGGGPEVTVVTDAYALAGAVAHYGHGTPVASGHNALWRMGPPQGGEVLLVGSRATALRDEFTRCTDAGALVAQESDPFGIAGSPMARCSSPARGWDALWPAFRHLGA